MVETNLTQDEIIEGKSLAEMLTVINQDEKAKAFFNLGIEMFNTGIHIGRQQAS